jgi:hypothetical protein
VFCFYYFLCLFNLILAQSGESNSMHDNYIFDLNNSDSNFNNQFLKNLANIKTSTKINDTKFQYSNKKYGISLISDDEIENLRFVTNK